MSTLRERLKQGAQFGSETVEAAPGVTIEIRELSSGKRIQFGSMAKKADKSDNPEDMSAVYRMLLAESAHDPDSGDRVWPPGNAKEVDELPGTLVERLGEVAMKVNGLDEAAAKEAKND